MQEVYLGLGSNLGNREENLLRALTELVKLGPLERSSWFETEPVGMRGTDEFLNGAVRLLTKLAPTTLLTAILSIEEKLGRRRSKIGSGEKTSRVIDIDILFYGDAVLNLPQLTVPHPYLHERAFVLVPLSELAPTLRHPVLGLTVAEMLTGVSLKGVRKWNRG